MQYKLLLVGAGQLGSRYLQGLSHCPFDLEITVADSSPESLQRAQSRWEEVAGQSVGMHNVLYLPSLPDGVVSYDIAIIATGAARRAMLVKECAERFAVRYWILEKVLAQSSSELDMIEKALADADGAWVNTPRRISRWHQQLRSLFAIEGTVICSVIGGDWGLACNSKSKGTAVNSDGAAFSGKLEFQSELTGPLVESILQTGICGLPTLGESLLVHRPFVTTMLEHWNRSMPEKRNEVPLT